LESQHRVLPCRSIDLSPGQIGHAQAADQLHWAVGTVKTRLDQARRILRTRLARRGAVLAAALLASDPFTMAVPAALLDGTCRAALPFAAGNTIADGAASAQALTLATGVLRTMWLGKLKTIMAALLAVTIVAWAGKLAYRGLAVEAPAQDVKKPDKPKPDKDAILGTWQV
jgi:hypothetical protein